MRRLATLSRAGRAAVLLIWGALFLLAVPLASKQVNHLTSGGFEVSGSQTEKAERVLREEFPQQSGEQIALLLEWQRGHRDKAAIRDALKRFNTAVKGEQGLVPGPLLIEKAPDGMEVALRPVEIHTTVREAIDRAVDLRAELDLGQPQEGPVAMELVGRAALVAAVNEKSEQDAKQAERIGAPVVLLILLAVFGSLAAAFLPLLTGAVSVVVTGALIYLLSTQFAMSVFVVNVASMIGIGVAVDYSLFMLARYREEIAAGRSQERARVVMQETSGRAIVFAGGTVAISLLSMFLIDNVILRSIAAGAMLVVIVAVLVSITAMPALVALLGRRLNAPSPFFVRIRAGLVGRRREDFWERWIARVMAHPLRNSIAVSAVLLLMASPLLALKLGVDTVGQLPAGDPARQASETAKGLVKERDDSPILVTASSSSATPAEARALRRVLKRTLESEEEIAWAEPALARPGAVLVEAVQEIDPEAEEGQAMVEGIRRRIGDLAVSWPQWEISVGGTAASLIDGSNQISDNLWKVIVAVLIFSFAILLVLLRSVILPLKAILMNLLTVGAASGLLVATFQWGWLQWLGIESSGHLETYVPPLIFAVVYGISMDYEVFLMTRIRERYDRSGDNWSAVVDGVASSAHTISSAALIMVVVFSIFVGTSVPIIQQIGLGTALAIALDATLVRLILLPAAMGLIGDLNWWLPGPLERMLGRARPLVEASQAEGDERSQLEVGRGQST
ncbi:MAG TPA: MMPL family transporter [Solirubrobacterales bacterium]|nr:MMPL family transporter [Solirubrobacterales bacterium]